MNGPLPGSFGLELEAAGHGTPREHTILNRTRLFTPCSGFTGCPPEKRKTQLNAKIICHDGPNLVS